MRTFSHRLYVKIRLIALLSVVLQSCVSRGEYLLTPNVYVTILLQSQRTVLVFFNFFIQNMKIIDLQIKMSILYVFPDFQSSLLYVR